MQALQVLNTRIQLGAGMRGIVYPVPNSSWAMKITKLEARVCPLERENDIHRNLIVLYQEMFASSFPIRIPLCKKFVFVRETEQQQFVLDVNADQQCAYLMQRIFPPTLSTMKAFLNDDADYRYAPTNPGLFLLLAHVSTNPTIDRAISINAFKGSTAVGRTNKIVIVSDESPCLSWGKHMCLFFFKYFVRGKVLRDTEYALGLSNEFSSKLQLWSYDFDQVRNRDSDPDTARLDLVLQYGILSGGQDFDIENVAAQLPPRNEANLPGMWFFMPSLTLSPLFYDDCWKFVMSQMQDRASIDDLTSFYNIYRRQSSAFLILDVSKDYQHPLYAMISRVYKLDVSTVFSTSNPDIIALMTQHPDAEAVVPIFPLVLHDTNFSLFVPTSAQLFKAKPTLRRNVQFNAAVQDGTISVHDLDESVLYDMRWQAFKLFKEAKHWKLTQEELGPSLDAFVESLHSMIDRRDRVVAFAKLIESLPGLKIDAGEVEEEVMEIDGEFLLF